MDYSVMLLQCFLVLFGLKSALCYTINEAALNDIGNRTQCVALCGECDCLAFFCGDECICECVSDAEKDIKCLAKLKTHCDTLNLPYDVLIQGSAGRRFVREIRENLSPKQKFFYRNNERNRRSVYNIHESNPWQSGKEEPMAFEDPILGAPGIAGDLEALVSRIKTDIVLKEIKNKLGLSPLSLKLTGKDILLADLDLKSDLRDKFRDGWRGFPLELDDVLERKLHPFRRDNILKEKIDRLADAVDGPGDDTIVETAARVLDFKLRSPTRLAKNLLRP